MNLKDNKQKKKRRKEKRIQKKMILMDYFWMMIHKIIHIILIKIK